MKRCLSLVALLSVAGTASALDPEVNLSGTFGLSLSYYDHNNDTLPSSETDVDLENNASNFRISASAQEGGITAFMAYERGASNDRTADEGNIEDVREFFGGLSGSLGTILYGRKATDYRIVGERLDPFFNTSVAGWNGGFASEGASYGLSNLTNGFTSNTIAIRSPVAGGFSGNLAAYINEADSNDGTGDKADYGAGVSYANSNWLGLDVGLQVLDLSNSVAPRPVTNSPGEGNAYRLHASLGQKLWSAGLSYELVDVKAEADARQYLFLSGTYQLAEKWRLAAGIGHVADTAATDGTGVTFGAFHDLTRNFSYYVAGRYVTLDDAADTRNITVASGVKFAFETDL